MRLLCATSMLAVTLLAVSLDGATTQPLPTGFVINNFGGWLLSDFGCPVPPVTRVTPSTVVSQDYPSCSGGGYKVSGKFTVTLTEPPAAMITVDPTQSYPNNQVLAFNTDFSAVVTAQGTVTIDQDLEHPDRVELARLYANAVPSDPVDPKNDPACPSIEQCSTNDVKQMKQGTSASFNVTRTTTIRSVFAFESDETVNGAVTHGWYFYIDGYITLSVGGRQIFASTRAQYFYPSSALVSVTTITPSVASSVAGITTDPLNVTITGTKFEQGAVLSITDLTPSNVTRVSDTQMTASVTGFRNATEGPRDVTVTNLDGKKGVGSGLFYVSSLGPELEVNQGGPIVCANDHPCVADHQTWIRVKLPCNGAGCETGKTSTTGRLFVKKNGAPLSGSPFSPNPRTMRVQQGGTPFSNVNLRNGADALNFRFNDTALDDGVYDFTFEINPRNPATAPSAASADMNKNLVVSKPSQPFKHSRIDRAIHISYIVDQAPRAAVLRPIEPFNLIDFLKATYPISSDLVTVFPSSHEEHYGEDLIPTLRALNHVAMFDAVANQPARTYVVMFTTDSRFDTPGASSCSEGSCWGSSSIILFEGDNSRASLAHEIGHHQRLGDTYTNAPPGGEDRSFHNPPCGHSSGCGVETGHIDTLRAEGSAFLSPSDPNFTTYTKRDVMGNAPRTQRWIDKRTWDYLYTDFMLTGAGKGQHLNAAVMQLVVRGTISSSDQVTFDPSLTYNGDELRVSEGGEYSVELQSASGATLSSRPFAISFKVPHRNRPISEAPFELSLPFPDGATKVVVKHGATVIGSRNISAAAPVVTVVSPNGGETVGATTSITWTATDADNDPLTYTLLYSRDGKEWNTIVSDLQATSYTWNTAAAAGSRTARVMVIASDGVNSTSDTSNADFTVAAKAPLVGFTSPADGAAFEAGLGVVLSAIGYDPEDGQLPASSVTYSSDKAGSLGSGSIIVTNLAVGVHTLTARAVDKDGNVSTSQIHITIFTPASDTRTMPAVASAPGALGSFFKTGVQIHNPYTTTIAGRFIYHPASTAGTANDPSTVFSLLSGETASYPDLLPTFSQNGLGSVDVVASFGKPPVTVTRVFNDAGLLGTTGLAEDVFRPGDVLVAGATGVLLAPSDPSRSRFNIGLRTLGSGASMTIKVRNKDGVPGVTITKSYPSNWFEQSASSAFLGTTLTASDSISVTITAGSAIVYGSTTDNTTQDPSVQVARAVPTGTATRILPAVASAAGSLGSFFRTSVQLHNPGTGDISGKLTFHQQGTTPAGTDPSIGYTLSAGRTIAYSDLLPAMGTSGFGTAEVVPLTGAPPVVAARVFNDGGSAGTTGFVEEAFRSEDALAAGEQGILITPSEPTRARFNIGVRTLGAGASITFTVRDKSGNVLKTITNPYAGNFFVQSPFSSLLGLNSAGDESIAITINSGSAIVYGSATDNTTQDPTVQFARKIE